ncbi:MAG: cytochrome C [Desulfovibrio sp.]|nr:cytochrome C [Desulfovibrio sp.]
MFHLRGTCTAMCIVLLVGLCLPAVSPTQTNKYIGPTFCAECHPQESANFQKYSKKAHSGDSVKRMAPGLTPDELKSCYSCHMTGFGQPGGFVSLEATPQMANAGCEVCHGPGAAHAESGGEKKLIKRKLTTKDCEVCHNAERVQNFNFKPLIFGGAH